MKRLAIVSVLVSCIVPTAYGNEPKAQKITYGSERSVVKGDLGSMVRTDIDHRWAKAGDQGDTLSVAKEYYSHDGYLKAEEFYNYFFRNHNYSTVYEYDENNRLACGICTYETNSGMSWYRADYTWENGLIAKREESNDGGIYGYTEYFYESNKEVRRITCAASGEVEQQTVLSWDGDRVIKVIEKSDGMERRRTITYPAKNTEIISVDDSGPGEQRQSYEITIIYDGDGNFKTYTTVKEYSMTEYHYSYEYDDRGNWSKRIIRDPDGKLVRIETREFTYWN